MNLLAKDSQKVIGADRFTNYFTRASRAGRMFMNPVFFPLVFGMTIYSAPSLGNTAVEVVHGHKISSSILAKPVVSELKITSVGRDSINIEGNIINDGGAVIKEKGIIYSLISNVNHEDIKIIDGSEQEHTISC